MGDSGNPPDLLSAALCESGFSLDDILNPSMEDDDEESSATPADPSSVLAQAMAASGVEEGEPDPLLQMLSETPSISNNQMQSMVSTAGAFTENHRPAVPTSSKQTIIIRRVTPSSSSSSASPNVLKIISSKPDGRQIVTTKPIILTTTTTSEKGQSNPVTSSNHDVPQGGTPLSKQFVKFVVNPQSPGVQATTKKTIVLNETKPHGLSRSNTDSSLLKPGVIRTTVSQTGGISNRVSSPNVIRNGSPFPRSASFNLPKKEDPPIKTKMQFHPSTSQGVNKTLTVKRRHPFRIIDDDDDDLDDDETLSFADTYANYTPSKLKIGQNHPDPVVETSSLASVQPPNVWYHLSIPEGTMDCGHISSLQLEAITYACQQHETLLPNGTRAGFLIGDGAGVGKGRTVAGVILENYVLGRKRALWLSVSNDLKYDAMRDLKDIGAGNIPVHSLNKFKYAKINSTENGHVRKGVIFATYSSLIGESQNRSKYRTRLKQILHWCGKDFDGVIVFDECHKAKNLVPTGSSKPTKTGITVLELQKQLPKARVVYCSATGASEPRNMAYMSRLGIWGKGTAFPDFNAFIQAIERRGVGAMEVVAMDMKLRGTYLSRQLSFHGVTFKIREVSLSESFKRIYNKSVQMWHMARDRFQKAAKLMDADQRLVKSMWGQFWSAHQRFFKYLCIAAKVKHVVKLARDSVKHGKCVVIGLQSTGEARTLDALEEAGGELNDFVSTAKGVFTALIEKHFPVPDRNKTMSMLGLSFNGNMHDDGDDDDEHQGNKGKRGKKRKKSGKKWKKKGVTRDWWAEDSESSSGDNDDDDDDEEDDEQGRKKTKETKKKDDEDDDSSSSSSDGLPFSDSDNEDDFNPFGNSDSDDDPWLNRSGRKSKEPKTKKRKKAKDKKSPSSSKSSKRNSHAMDSVDTAADNALRALGIIPKTPRSLSTDAAPTTLQGLSSSVPSATKSSVLPGMDAYERGRLMRQELMDTLEELSAELPPNTLDELIDELGGPDNVAEMTGRKGRVVSHDNGVQYESRSECDIPLEILNLTEKRRFMEGDKYVAIISEAASSGISLQADRRVANQKKRVHITLELPWSADRAVQQFGRTHRSNQVAAPEYVFLISELAGEQRFASIVAKRLESLGALTHGDRRATESKDLSRFNIDTKYGREALELIMRTILDLDTPIVEPPGGDKFFDDVKKALVGVGLLSYNEDHDLYFFEKDYSSIPKFLNRLLGMEVDLQNSLFKYFSDTMVTIISRAKKEGQWDAGIMDISNERMDIRRIHTDTYVAMSGNATTELHKVGAERGMSWKNAIDMWSELSQPEEGFYISQLMKFGRKVSVLARFPPSSNKKGALQIFKPNIGLQSKLENLSDLKLRFRKVLPDEAKPFWIALYAASENKCAHIFWKGTCKTSILGLPCEIGLRRRTFYVLSGAVLSVWARVEEVLRLNPRNGAIMQIIRLKTDRGKLVGLLIPSNCVPALKDMLSKDTTSYSETF